MLYFLLLSLKKTKNTTALLQITYPRKVPLWGLPVSIPSHLQSISKANRSLKNFKPSHIIWCHTSTPHCHPKEKKIPLLLGWSRKSLQLLKSTQSGLFLCLQCHSGCFLPGLIRSWLLLLLTYTLAFFRSLKGQGTFLPQGLCTAVSSACITLLFDSYMTFSIVPFRSLHKYYFLRK